VLEDGLVPIGELARRTGVATSALRYYERIGLLSPAGRAGRRRHYHESSVERVALIRLCQDAGFTLAEIGRLLPAWSHRRRGWTELAERKIAELDARIANAQRARELVTHALECPHRDLLACPNFRSAVDARMLQASSGRRSGSAEGSRANPGLKTRGHPGATTRLQRDRMRQSDT
jgi:DNA-binding transcriptional MerR regulator